MQYIMYKTYKICYSTTYVVGKASGQQQGFSKAAVEPETLIFDCGAVSYTGSIVLAIQM